MKELTAKIQPGDLVELKAPDEILQTLDAEGTLGYLPFMPEMLEFFGQRFRVSKRVVMTCCYGPGSPRGFGTDDIVTLDEVRCSGAAHDGCQKACLIFWREAWLRKATDASVQSTSAPADRTQLRARLKTSANADTYFCQASELSKATYSLSRSERIRKYLSGIHVGNFGPSQMAQDIGIWLFWKLRRMILGVYPRGKGKSTPMESLNLQPGEWIEVKPIESIIETLDQNGRNHGLDFWPSLRLLCGRRLRVKDRIDKIIVDGTGKMRQLRNTVRLEGSNCVCSYLGFGMGGCSRCEIAYWRESWLRRPEQTGDRSPD